MKSSSHQVPFSFTENEHLTARNCHTLRCTYPQKSMGATLSCYTAIRRQKHYSHALTPGPLKSSRRPPHTTISKGSCSSSPCDTCPQRIVLLPRLAPVDLPACMHVEENYKKRRTCHARLVLVNNLLKLSPGGRQVLPLSLQLGDHSSSQSRWPCRQRP